MLLLFFALIIAKQLTSSVTWPFDSRWVTSYGWSILTMRLSILHRYGDGASYVGQTHVRTHAQTLRWFYTLFNAMHCIGQTKG